MSLVLDPEQRRVELADRIKTLDDITLPHLSIWNYNACSHHTAIGAQVDCAYRECGGSLFSHQRLTVAWLLAKRRGLLASEPGTGKTNSILFLLAYLKEKGELTNKALVIPNTPAVKQWGDEFTRWAPGLKVLVVKSPMTKDERINKYSTDWDVLVIGQHLAMQDKDILERMCPFDAVINDDVDALLDHKNRSHKTIRDLSKNATYAVTVNATVLQVRLQQLHAALVPAGGYDVFGSLRRFESRYVRTEYVEGRRQSTGYRNINELKDKVSHLYIRYKADELVDVRMPDIMPPVTEWFDMSAAQREKYAELQAGVLTLMREEGTDIKRVNALTKWTYGQQICAGLPALGLPDGPGASPKLDKLFHNLQTVWADRKVIVFVKNVGMVRAAIARAAEQDMGLALIWGQKQNADQREEQKKKFWEDDNCNLLIGTTSLERSLNLQCSNTVVLLDTHLNPARVAQIVGRARRAGSRHSHIWVYQYYMTDSQEERYDQVLRERQALHNTIFQDESALFEQLSSIELLRLMQP